MAISVEIDNWSTVSWDVLVPGDVAQWRGNGYSVIVMKVMGGGFVNLETGALTTFDNVAVSPDWRRVTLTVRPL